MNVFFKSRSVDKKHAVITILEEQGLHFIHDLDTLNGVSSNLENVQLLNSIVQ